MRHFLPQRCSSMFFAAVIAVSVTGGALGAGELTSIAPIQHADFESAQASSDEWIELSDLGIDGQIGDRAVGSPRPTSAMLDGQDIAVGRAAFETACTTCHEAERAFATDKNFGEWLNTVRRMAAKDGADISRSDIRTARTTSSPSCARGSTRTRSAARSFTKETRPRRSVNTRSLKQRARR